MVWAGNKRTLEFEETSGNRHGNGQDMKEQLPVHVEAVKEQVKGRFIGTRASGYGCAVCGWA